MQILFISLTRKRLLCHEAVLLVSVSSASIHVQPEQHGITGLQSISARCKKQDNLTYAMITC